MLPVCSKIAQFVNFESEMYKSAFGGWALVQVYATEVSQHQASVKYNRPLASACCILPSTSDTQLWLELPILIHNALKSTTLSQAIR